jgi:hypothetical protein
MGFIRRSLGAVIQAVRPGCVVALIGAVTLTVCLYYAAEYELSLVVVRDGVHTASLDLATLRSVHSNEPPFQVFRVGTAFTMAPGTRCRILLAKPDLGCPKVADYVMEVRVLSGSHYGDRAWLCFSDVSFVHPML